MSIYHRSKTALMFGHFFDTCMNSREALHTFLAIPVGDAIWDCARSFFFFCHDFVRAISLEPLLAETPNSVCCLVLRSNCALLLTIQFASLFIYFFFSRQDFVRAISLEPLLAETPN